jgi:exo-1,4-beta-D-glucosaminidase
MKVSAKIYNIDAKEKASRNATLDLAADSSRKAFDLPIPDGLSATFFLKLELRDAAGNLVSDNFYWLSTKADTLDWAKRADTDYTPQKDFADLTGLNELPKAKVAIAKSDHVSGREQWITVSVVNNGESVAFMVHPRLTRGKGGEDVVPVFWSDNYFSLLPGEKKSVTAKFDISSLAGAAPELVVEGWNIDPITR